MEKILKTKGRNCLLVKTEMGKSKPPTILLPGKEFVYGYPNKYEKDAVKKLTSSWSFQQKSDDKLPIIDFIKLNKIVWK